MAFTQCANELHATACRLKSSLPRTPARTGQTGVARGGHRANWMTGWHTHITSDGEGIENANTIFDAAEILQTRELTDSYDIVHAILNDVWRMCARLL